MNDRIWQRNNAAFEKRYGFPIPDEAGAEKHYRVGEALNGMPILYSVDEETGEESRLNSLYNPVYEAERFADKFKLENTRLLIAMQGFLDGYFAKAMLNRLTRSDSYVAVYEANISLFMFVCHHFDITELLEHPSFVIYLPGHHKETYYAMMSEKIADINKANLYLAVTPFYALEQDFYEACNSMRDYLAADANTRIKMGEHDALNFLRTLKGLSTNSSLFHLKETFQDTDIPAIIVAAGPSLQKNAELLREVYDKALIIAVDRAVPTLAGLNIKPHMTATVDAVKAPVFLESDFVKDLPVLFYAMGNRATQDAHEGHLIYFGVGGTFYGIDGLDELLMPYGNVGGSVATAIFTCLEQIGFQNIILIGQDLAYDAEFHTHADGSVRNPEWHDLEEVDGIDGGKVMSRFDWVNFIRFYEQEIIAHPEVNVVDATEGGAFIRGSKVMTFREAIDIYCVNTCNVATRLQSLPPAVEGEQKEHLLKQIREFLPQLKAIRGWAKESVVLSDQVKKAAQYGKDVFEEYYVKKMNDAETGRALIRMQPVHMLLENYAVLSKDELPGDELFVRTQQDALEIYRLLGKYFRLLEEKAEPLAEQIRAVFGFEEDENEEGSA